MGGVKALVVAGVSSGSGKTTVVGALAAALVEKGYRVQVYKVGPDYIDPGHHRAMTGRPVRSLDVWMMGEEGVRTNFARGLAGTDVALVEGVGGFYDGLGVTETASTAQVAKILGLPTVLVVDAWGMSRSAAALVKGFKDFDPGVNLVGVVFNMVGSPGHAGLLQDVLKPLGVPFLGYLLRRREGAIPERHLGLRLAQELDWESRREVLKDLASNLDVEGLLSVAASLDPEDFPTAPWFETPLGDLTIAVARDEAFAFLYEESLEALREAGGRLLFFSPVKGEGVPPEARALYLPGGYPELHGEALESNEAFRRDVRELVDSGLPLYAECGGLIYLARRVEYKGRVFSMAGLFPIEVSFGGRPILGYARGRATRHHPFLTSGREVKGHVFHYSLVREEKGVDRAYLLEVPSKKVEIGEGYVRGRAMATYLHLNLAFAPALVEGIFS